MQAENNTWGPLPHCSSHISKIVWWLPKFDLGISFIYSDSWDISDGSPFQVFIKFNSLFSFLLSLFPFLFFSFLFFSFLFFSFLSLLGPLSSGAPGHCPPMSPSRYATVKNEQCKTWPRVLHVSTCILHVLVFLFMRLEILM